MNWDDVRIFLAVASEGAIRRGARKLRLDHSTVSRRLAAFQRSLGVTLLELREGTYVLTPAGEQLMATAHSVEEELEGVELRILNRDAMPRGDLRVSVPGPIASSVVPAIADFSRSFPEIDVELVVSNALANLSRREADVAIRVTGSKPEHLAAERIAGYAMTAYASKKYLSGIDLGAHPEDARWIGWDQEAPYPRWLKDDSFAQVPIRCRFDDVVLQFEAARSGMGIAVLPCFLGDPSPELVRLTSGAEVVADVWLVHHPDLRATARVRAFVEFMTAALGERRALFEGSSR